MRVVILGAGFGGLELSTMLSESDQGGVIDVALIDKSDAFVFGYSKLDVMFGRTSLDAVRLPYSEIAKPGVRVLQETITAIDPVARRVTTDAGVHEADVLVVALGADYDVDATPGLAEAGNEFTRSPAPNDWPSCYPPSRAAGLSSASAARPTSARRRRAKPLCSCTTTCRRAASATLARSRWSRRSAPRSRPRPTRRRRCLPRSPSVESRSSPGAASRRSTPAEALPCSTTAASCPSTSSSASPGTVPPTS
jgi:cation diffusion facilitator CzcD-associated flavoprotein CzcO